jgi:uncharacterized membrane protein
MELLKDSTLWLAAGVEAIAAGIVGFAILEATLRAVVLIVRGDPARQVDDSHDAKEDVRLRLGRWLALALEFLLAADILETAVAPTWEEIGQLAAIAALRTALNSSFSARSTPPSVVEGRAKRPSVPAGVSC